MAPNLFCATGRAELLFWLAKRERERRRDPRAMAREGAQIFNFVYFGEPVPGTTIIFPEQKRHPGHLKCRFSVNSVYFG